MIGKEYLKLRKTKCVLRFHVPSKLKNPEAYAHHLLLLYYPFRKEEELKGEFGTYGEKLIDPDIIECIRTNQRICEPFGEIVDDAFENFNRETRGFDIQGEQENDDVMEDFRQNNDYDEKEDEETYKGGAPLQPVQPIISDAVSYTHLTLPTIYSV